jgi:hypothetical protein
MREFAPFTCEEEVAAIAEGMLDRTLWKSKWTHAAHFATALWMLRCFGIEETLRRMPGAIRAYNESTGGANTETSGYHETITVASIRAAERFRCERAGAPLWTVCNELMASELGRPEWVLEYWSRERLFSVEARRIWIEPDLRELPF